MVQSMCQNETLENLPQRPCYKIAGSNFEEERKGTHDLLSTKKLEEIGRYFNAT